MLCRRYRLDAIVGRGLALEVHLDGVLREERGSAADW
jgi:hypothetical protein